MYVLLVVLASNELHFLFDIFSLLEYTDTESVFVPIMLKQKNKLHQVVRMFRLYVAGLNFINGQQATSKATCKVIVPELSAQQKKSACTLQAVPSIGDT